MNTEVPVVDVLTILRIVTHATFRRDVGHDGRQLADLVAEWAGTHCEPIILELTGPAGATFRSGTGAEQVSLDAVEFARTISGRREGKGALRHPPPL